MAGGNKKKTLDKFIEDANAKHNNFYSYDKVTEYSGSFGEITVTCPTHGDFITTPSKTFAGF